MRSSNNLRMVIRSLQAPELKLEFAADYRKGAYIREFVHEFIDIVKGPI